MFFKGSACPLCNAACRTSERPYSAPAAGKSFRFYLSLQSHPGLSRKCRFFCRRIVLWPVMAANCSSGHLLFRTLPLLQCFSTNRLIISTKISIFHILTQHKQTVKLSFLAALFFYSISPTFFSRPPLLPFSLL